MENVLNPDTDYAICGYNEETNEGYDWNGCGCDWCFKCGKILCKKWQANDLFILTNTYNLGKIEDEKDILIQEIEKAATRVKGN